MGEESEKRVGEKQWWYFTFGCGQGHAGRFVKIFGTVTETRDEMFRRYEKYWSMQYSEKEWTTSYKGQTMSERWGWTELK